MQNSAHFGKNGASNLVCDAKILGVFLPLIYCVFTEKGQI